MIIRILSLTILSGCWAIGQTQPIGLLSLHNAPLLNLVNVLASQARINYVLDPRVKIAKSVNTYGESQNMDARKLLDLILRINGAQMERSDGDIVRIVPIEEASNLPDETVLDLVFLKNMPAEEISRFLSQASGRDTVASDAPTGLLMILH